MANENNKTEKNPKVREVLLEQYEKYLCGFCRESAYMEDMKIRIESGIPVTRVEAVSHMSAMRNCKEALLEVKHELGLSDGLKFTDNADYQGFSYRNGELVGDCTHLYKIIKPWLDNFNPKEPYKYEVGILLLFHYKFGEERKKRQLQEDKKISKFKRILRWIFPRIWVYKEERKQK